MYYYMYEYVQPNTIQVPEKIVLRPCKSSRSVYQIISHVNTINSIILMGISSRLSNCARFNKSISIISQNQPKRPLLNIKIKQNKRININVMLSGKTRLIEWQKTGFNQTPRVLCGVWSETGYFLTWLCVSSENTLLDFCPVKYNLSK